MTQPMTQPLAKTLLAAAVLAALCSLAGCSHPGEPDAEALGAATGKYLAARGDLCLAKTHWPIDVTQREIDSGGRNARQMPALERLGLVSSGVAEVDVDDEGAVHHMKVRRFALTDAGRRFYIAHGTKTEAGRQVPTSDFCAAHLSLDKVVGWQMRSSGERRQAVVTYTYRVDAAPWTRDAEIQSVFPVVAGVVRGERQARLQETFEWRSPDWVAVDLL